MSDKLSLNEWRDQALEIATQHGFTDSSVGESLMLMVSELSEALEDLRAGAQPAEAWFIEKIPAFNHNGERLLVAGKPAHVEIQHHRPYPRDSNGNPDIEHPYKPCGIPSEIADVVIRALHFAGKHGIDIEEAVRLKMEFNRTRPYKHGKTI